MIAPGASFSADSSLAEWDIGANDWLCKEQQTLGWHCDSQSGI